VWIHVTCFLANVRAINEKNGRTLVGSLANLDQLKVLDLRGPLDDKFRDLANLEYLDLRSNTLAHRRHRSLRPWDISRSCATCTWEPTHFPVPFLPLWATRPSLQFLALNNNGLAGSVPSSLSKLTSLEYLFLDDDDDDNNNNNNNNIISGGIPNSLTKLAALKELILNNN
jgi:hypothetical protein